MDDKIETAVTLQEVTETWDGCMELIRRYCAESPVDAVGELHQYMIDNYGFSVIPEDSLPKRDSYMIREEVLAAIIGWTLKRDKISARAIHEDHDISRECAGAYVHRLEELGIVEKHRSFKPHRVLMHSYSELPVEAKQLFVKYGNQGIGLTFHERREIEALRIMKKQFQKGKKVSGTKGK